LPNQVTTPAGAVFLSYASQDAEAAKRICDALRTVGIEVWFDQSELRGGDAWDQSIREFCCRWSSPTRSKPTNASPSDSASCSGRTCRVARRRLRSLGRCNDCASRCTAVRRQKLATEGIRRAPCQTHRSPVIITSSRRCQVGILTQARVREFEVAAGACRFTKTLQSATP